jgi:hypothetical protein
LIDIVSITSSNASSSSSSSSLIVSPLLVAAVLVLAVLLFLELAGVAAAVDPDDDEPPPEDDVDVDPPVAPRPLLPSPSYRESSSPTHHNCEWNDDTYIHIHIHHMSE